MVTKIPRAVVLIGQINKLNPELLKLTKMKSRNLAVSATVLLAVVLAWSCGPAAERRAEVVEAPPNTLTEQEKEEGFILMFDGETTTGWRSYNGDAFPEQGWAVEEGTLRCIGTGNGESGSRGGDIVYDGLFRDFHLKVDWKISEGGNSGIFYLGREIEGRPIHHTAPEFQILDNDRHSDARRGVDGNRKAAALYDILPAVPQNTLPAGEWNRAEIIVYRGSVFHRQNGEDVVEYNLGTPEWEEMVEKSKFDVELFGKYIEGVIGLQGKRYDVWFRNIKIREY